MRDSGTKPICGKWPMRGKLTSAAAQGVSDIAPQSKETRAFFVPSAIGAGESGG